MGWHSSTGDGVFYGIYAQRFTAQGEKFGGQFLNGGGEPLAKCGGANHAASRSASARSVVTSTPVQVDHSVSARSVYSARSASFIARLLVLRRLLKISPLGSRCGLWCSFNLSRVMS